MKPLFFLSILCILYSCNSKKTQTVEEEVVRPVKEEVVEEKEEKVIDYDVTKWKELTLDDGVVLDLRYATANNFTEKQIYPCGRCFLRPELASRILELQKDIEKRYGMRLKLFDCYRPKPAQQKLWDIVPNEKYVTNPKKGSMHNRGLAVDITLVDKDGKELDMGTEYDFFGRKAHTDFFDLPEEVLKNRKILTKMMEIHGLKGIQSEWWHFSLKTIKAPFDDWQWPCN